MGLSASQLMAKLPHLTLWPVLSQQLGLGEGGFSAILCSDWSCSTPGRPASALLGDLRGWPAIWSHRSFPFLVSSLVPGAGGVTALGSSPQVSSASGCVGVALSKVEFPFLCLVLVLGVASKSRSV